MVGEVDRAGRTALHALDEADVLHVLLHDGVIVLDGLEGLHLVWSGSGVDVPNAQEAVFFDSSSRRHPKRRAGSS